MSEIWILRVKIRYSDNCVTIMNSYEIEDESEMRLILRLFKMRTGYRSKRSLTSWIKEWRAHNRLYEMKIARSKTKDCDLEEEIERWREIAYYIIGSI